MVNLWPPLQKQLCYSVLFPLIRQSLAISKPFWCLFCPSLSAFLILSFSLSLSLSLSVSSSVFPSTTFFLITPAALNGWLLHFQAPRTENRSYIQIKRPGRRWKCFTFIAVKGLLRDGLILAGNPAGPFSLLPLSTQYYEQRGNSFCPLLVLTFSFLSLFFFLLLMSLSIGAR